MLIIRFLLAVRIRYTCDVCIVYMSLFKVYICFCSCLCAIYFVHLSVEQAYVCHVLYVIVPNLNCASIILKRKKKQHTIETHVDRSHSSRSCGQSWQCQECQECQKCKIFDRCFSLLLLYILLSFLQMNMECKIPILFPKMMMHDA